MAISCVCVSATGMAQPGNKYSADAFVITRMAQKFHVQPRPMDENFSTLFFDHFMKAADDERVIFTAEDMTRLLPYRTKLAEEVIRRQNGFLKTVTEIYEQRIRRFDSLLLRLGQQPFSFTAEEKITVAEDSAYVPAAQAAQKLVKLIKKEMLDYILEKELVSSTTPLARQKKVVDSLEPEARKKIITAFQRGIQRVQQGAVSIPATIGNLYCQSLAATFDPHSSYMPKTEKENFETIVGGKAMRFGFSLQKDGKDLEIKDLRPGSAAFKSGQINKGDKLVNVQWDGKQGIDVSDAGLEEVSDIMDQSNYGKMILTVRKADGTMRKVELQKETMEADDDENKLKSFVLKNQDQAIGYLSLPAFYTDFDDPQNNVKGCANDVAKSIMRLKKENINGLIIDLRYNGGGSMLEAVELSGIFIDAGPVAQISKPGGKVYTLKDVNRGTVYDGPLLVLVNGASASASEMVAGTLQDYHRAIIMGTPTYGKATGQVILPLDSLVTPENIRRGAAGETFLKLTIEKLYRITGATAQRDGVIPDIQLPDLTESMIPRESAEATALLAQRIDANKFYTPYAGENLAKFVYTGRAWADTAAWFQLVKKKTVLLKEMNQKTAISLKWADALRQWEKEQAEEEELDELEYDADNLFVVHNPEPEEQRLKLNPEMKEINTAWKTSMQHDAWIATAFRLLSAKK